MVDISAANRQDPEPLHIDATYSSEIHSNIVLKSSRNRISSVDKVSGYLEDKIPFSEGKYF